MSVETIHNLDSETKEALQDLLTLNIDSRDGFHESSQKIDDVTIGSLCQTLSMQRQAQADEIAQLMEIAAERVDREGSFAAAAHRIWIDIRESLANDNTYSILAEAERGEDRIKEAYETYLESITEPTVRDLLSRHYTQVCAAHDRIRMLRDEFKD